MAKRGDINSPWAGRAKEYAWSKCLELAPRNITPTDIDFSVDCAGKFLFFEMKTENTPIPDGQRIHLERLLENMGPGHFVMVAEHPILDRVDVPDDITKVQLWHENDGGIWKSESLPGTAFAALYRAFFEEAEGMHGAMRDAYRKWKATNS